MDDQRVLSPAAIPPPSDPRPSTPEKIIVALLNVMSGPYLLCEPNVTKGLRKTGIVIQEDSSIAQAVEVPVEPEVSWSNSAIDWIDFENLLNKGPLYLEESQKTHGTTSPEAAVRLPRLALVPDLTWSEWPNVAAFAYIATFQQHYEQTGDIKYIDEAIRLSVQWLETHASEHAERGQVLHNLAHCLYLHYKRTWSVEYLRAAIVIQQDCIALRPQGHPLRGRSLGNLASLFLEYRSLAGNLEDLDDIVAILREALGCCPPGALGRETILNNLAEGLADRYECTANPGDLGEAIAHARESLSLHPPGHPRRYTSLNTLARCLRKRFARMGDLADLEGAIGLQRESLECSQSGELNRDLNLNNLATYLSERHKRTGNLGDLENATTLHQQCLELRPRGHPSRSASLSQLALCLNARFVWAENTEDLEGAINLQRESLELCPPGHPSRHSCLGDLSVLLATRYIYTGGIADLEAAITLQQESLHLRPQGHPLRPTTLSNLAACFSNRFNRTNNIRDLVEAINLQRESLQLGFLGDPSRAYFLLALVRFLVKKGIWTLTRVGDRYAHGTGLWETPTHATEQPASSPLVAEYVRDSMVYELLREAAQHSMSAIDDRMTAATLWQMLAHRLGNPSELEATKTMLNLLDLAVAESTSLEGLSNRLSDKEQFRDAQGVASDGAALALGSGDLRLAVSLLEQGRLIIYSQLGRYRSAIDDSHRVSPELATRLVGLGVELDALVVRGERVDLISNTKKRSFDDDTSWHFNVRTAWNETIEEIRQLPGLEFFLLPTPFERLQEAANEGPIVIVNINKRRSDAIIVPSRGDPNLVPLPEASPEAVQAIIDGFGERPAECTTRKAIGLLREIWAIIVGPIVAQLSHTLDSRPEKPRIWWCPTGVASKLPLHAAGPYKRGEKNLSDIFVSSYTPTLGTLIRARRAKAAGQTGTESSNSILVVGQPDTPGENPLPQVVDEVQAVKRHAPHASVLLSSEGTKEAVLSGIRTNSWLHLACHGHYDVKQPFHSSFSMHDGRITLLELIGRDLPQAELAFLSACHSARASETLPDEALHPAAGMLFAGFKSVIGTMWAFDDGVGSALAGKFYELMTEGNKGYKDAAVVLADAIQDIVTNGRSEVPFMQRINVVHYGV